MILLKLKESMSYFKLNFNKPTNYVKSYFFEGANNLFTFFYSSLNYRELLVINYQLLKKHQVELRLWLQVVTMMTYRLGEGDLYYYRFLCAFYFGKKNSNFSVLKLFCPFSLSLRKIKIIRLLKPSIN